MITNAFFWNRIAKRYSKQPIADQAAYEKKLKLTQEYFTPASRVLEFGCGTGSTAIIHALHVNYYLATDISKGMLKYAKNKAAKAKLGNLTFEQTDLLSLDSPSASWDVILGMSILHLLPNRHVHLRKVYELLKPGGVFISSTACIADMNTVFKLIAPIFRLTPLLPSVEVFGQQELKTQLEQIGFKIEYDWCPGLDKAVIIVARKPHLP